MTVPDPQTTRRLHGRTALVTGAGGGIGRAICTAFAREGATVICQDIDADGAAAAAHAVDAAGAQSVSWTCDVADSAAINEMFDAVCQEVGPVDVLVNNAGVGATRRDARRSVVPLVDMADEAWTSMLDVHLNGAFFCTREAVRRLLEANRTGSIIFMSSIAALGGHGGVHYSTAKAGLLGFMRSLARGLGPQIRVNAIAPGPIATPMTDSLGQTLDQMVAAAPLARIGRPEEVADAAVFLASDESSYFTGQCLSPNGGLVM